MSETLDGQLKQAIKDAVSDDLKGWEFTLAMQANVLRRLQAEELGTVPDPQPRRHRLMQTLRPLSWVAVAAAAFLIAMNVDWRGSVQDLLTGSSAKDVAPAGSSPKQEGNGDSTSTTSANREAMTDSKSSSGAQESSNLGIPKVASGESGGSASTRQSATKQSFGPADMAGPGESDGAAGGNKSLAAPNGTSTGMSDSEHTTVLQINAVALRDEGATVAKPTTDAQATVRVASAHEPGRVIAVTKADVRKIDAGGVVQWAYALPGLSEASRVSVGPDGQVAVNAGSQVYVLSQTGTLAYRVLVQSAPADLTLRPAGSGSALVVLTAGPDRKLTFYDAAGIVQTTISVDGEGTGLAASADGNVLLVGRQAYDPVGRLLWQAPIVPHGVAVSGHSFLVWDYKRALRLDAVTGRVIWRAQPGVQRADILAAVPEVGGGRSVILVALNTQGGIWVVDSGGTQIAMELLPAPPAGAALTENHVVVLTPGGLRTYSLAR